MCPCLLNLDLDLNFDLYLDVDRIDTSQLRAKCVKRMIKITIKIEIKNSQKDKL